MSLREEDFRAAMDFVRGCELAGGLEEFRAAVMRVVEQVPGHIISYNEVDLANEELAVRVDPPEVGAAENVAAFGRFAHQHPVIGYVEATGDLSPRAISDFLAAEEFHSLDLYQQLYRRLEVEDQIAFGLPGPRELVLGVAINRSQPGFSDRDRAFLQLVAPEAGRAYLMARARSAVRAALASEELVPSASGALIVLGRGSAVEAASPRVGELLEEFLGAGLGPTGELPPPLAEHAARNRGDRGVGRPPLAELLVRRRGARLRACFVAGASAGEPDVLVLEVEPDPLAPARIRRLGLTEREAAVVALLAEGRGNDEIAAELKISPLTVKRHLENVYDKLGVRTRAGVLGQLLRS